MPRTPTRIFLVTLSPGEDLIQAFGHTALLFDDGRATAELTTYSYGGFTVPQVRPHFGTGSAWDAIGAAALEALLPLVERTFRARKCREPFAQLKSRASPFQSLFVEELALTSAQRERLQQRVAEDFESVEPGEKARAVYRYDHFFDNCVTRLRDQIFAVLEDVPALYQRGEVDESFEQIIEESLADAMAACPFGLRLFPAQFEAAVSMFAPGLPSSAHAPSDFLRSLELSLRLLAKSAAFSGPVGRAALERARTILDQEIPKRPRSFRDTLFTPKRFREALASWPNAQTGTSVLACEPGALASRV